ncbi:MAG TPA: HEPN domain-containing protein [Thermoplasmata archaeon]|nr:HEPN domain-containing protein [Thermoplasmata archaeon]
MDKLKHVNYVKKSDEFARAMESSLERGDWDAAVSNAVHAGIAMADALNVFYLGQRSADQDHARARELLVQLPFDPAERDKNARHLDALLQAKGTAEYEDRLLTESVAKSSVERAARFRRWGRSKLP